ncbi:MAG: PBP1A family penicillin-binding protein [Myxococcaceae bacterium]|nr:PBP1A family penicillin-binding protein [Myxococcaceae bacterium]
MVAPLASTPPRWKLWLKRLATGLLASVVLALGGGTGTYWYFSRGLPSVEELRHHVPAQVSKVYCRNGEVCAEYFVERRTWVDVSKMPKHVREMFLAAEDADFYKHQGLDFTGMARAFLKALRPGSRAGGASTISQQACRNLLLTRERTLSRKVKELILTPRMEAALTKDEILNLYVNTVWFGHQRYGIEEAALFYFGKHAADLSVGEAAVLAGTVQLPHRINPLTSVSKAKRRQTYVLGQAARHGFITQAVADAEIAKPIVLGPRPPPPVGGYYAEELRKTLVARYGDKAVLEGGLRVEVPMDPRLQAAAESAVRAGLEALDKRQGYRGPLGNLDLQRWTALRTLLEGRVAEAGRQKPDEELVADLEPLQALTVPDEDPDVGRLEPEEVDGDEPIPSDDERRARAVRLMPLATAGDLVALVTAVDDAKGLAVVDTVGREGQLTFASVAWARRRSGEGALGPAPTRMSEVVAPGDLVRVRLGKAVPASRRLEATLTQRPVVQGALVAINPADRTVLAMVGGYDFGTSAFNRATQARRQPGSSFKPFLYGAALASGKFTPVTIVNDAPEAVRDPWTGKTWKPQNFEKGGFEGPMTLRAALTKSKNTVSVRLIEALTPQVVIDFAQKAGIRSELPDNLTLALGTGEVSMLEIANAYATLHSLGKFAEPVMLTKVTDAKGTILEEHHASFEEVLPPAAAYLTTSLMRSVVEEGTATAVRELERPAAGKTGTAQEYRDAWFSGYTADLVVSSWVGFDDHSSLGPNETGGRAALPLWLSFMREATQGVPVSDFPVPPGVVQVRIDPASGLLAGKAVPGRTESFLEGTEPKQEAPPPGQVDPNDFLLHDGRRN